MEGILALLFLSATSQYAVGHHFSAIHTSHGFLGAKLLAMTASILSVTGLAYSDTEDLKRETQSLVASYNASEEAEDLLFQGSKASSSAGSEDGEGFAQSSSFSGGKNASSFARSSASSGSGNAYAVSSSSIMRKSLCRKADLISPHIESKEFSMINETEYRCYRVRQKANILNFKVKTAYSAYIALLSDQKFHGPTYEVFLGGWGNTKSAIKDKFEIQHYANEVETPNVLSEEEFRGFWIRWDGGVIMVGKEGLEHPFMEYTVPDLFQVKYLCFFPGSRSASWIIQGVANK